MLPPGQFENFFSHVFLMPTNALVRAHNKVIQSRLPNALETILAKHWFSAHTGEPVLDRHIPEDDRDAGGLHRNR